jgi:hypothetical protein
MIRRLGQSIDSIDLLYGIFPAAAGCAALITWSSMIVRAIRGEEVKEGITT